MINLKNIGQAMALVVAVLVVASEACLAGAVSLAAGSWAGLMAMAALLAADAAAVAAASVRLYRSMGGGHDGE